MNLAPLQQLINSLENFDAKAVISDIVDNNAETLAQLQREQLIDGEDITGSVRSDQYAPLTVRIKKEYGRGAGAITDRVTFFMTGTLSESLFFKRTADNYTMFSPLATYDKMLSRIKDEKFGLSPEKRLYFAKNVTLPEFGKVLKDKTGLKI